MIARHGSDWFRGVGHRDEPGTMLVTVTCDGARRVIETPTGRTVGEVLTAQGMTAERCSAVLVGGYFGTWMTRDQAWALPLTHLAMTAAGGSLGAGILVPLPGGVCGLAETARVIGYLAAENAGQCGPCFNGLPAIAAAMQALATRGAGEPALSRWLSVVPGRGACAHPDGATRLVASALATFAGDVERHLRQGPCRAAGAAPLLPVPAHRGNEGWE